MWKVLAIRINGIPLIQIDLNDKSCSSCYLQQHIAIALFLSFIVSALILMKRKYSMWLWSHLRTKGMKFWKLNLFAPRWRGKTTVPAIHLRNYLSRVKYSPKNMEVKYVASIAIWGIRQRVRIHGWNWDPWWAAALWCCQTFLHIAISYFSFLFLW